MRSGLDCGGEAETRAMTHSANWRDYVLGLRMVGDPGTKFGYCSAGYHLLSAALGKATGQSALAYARAKLFEPMGISDVYWPADPNGNNRGWGDLQLRPRDMAKIGLLMLNRGRWMDRQLVPASWVDSVATAKVLVNDNEDYSYGWWVSRRVPGLFEANGRGGQRISVIPRLDLVVVMTGGGFEPGDIGAFIAKAVRDTAQAPDLPAQRRLVAAVEAAAKAPPARAVKVSPLAQQVSGVTFQLDENPLGIRSLRLDFSDSARAVLRLSIADGELVQPVGLDGLYRTTREERSGALAAGRGEWNDDGSFGLELNRLARINLYRLAMTFRGDQLELQVREATEAGNLTLRGRAIRKATASLR
jgi:hypothetical protein